MLYGVGCKTFDVSQEIAAPQVDAVIHQDAVSGRTLEILTEDFRFTPERASSEHTAGEGRAHLYIDENKVARVYGHWLYIPEPAPGIDPVRVTLNSNSHQDFAVGDMVTEDVGTLTVPAR